jgi:18S rRNA (guanine1575-N7)-methyltransferase
MSRPEHVAPPEMFYSGEEARKYATNSRMREIQSTLSERAMELLALDGENKMILDVGCGSGLSGEVITEHGHQWIGCDISHDMLKVAVEQEVEGDVVVNDMGQGLPFRPGSFDGCISISAVQWLCNAEGSHSNPHRRLLTFFTSLFRCLVRGGRAVLQVCAGQQPALHPLLKYFEEGLNKQGLLLC